MRILLLVDALTDDTADGRRARRHAVGLDHDHDVEIVAVHDAPVPSGAAGVTLTSLVRGSPSALLPTRPDAIADVSATRADPSSVIDIELLATLLDRRPDVVICEPGLAVAARRALPTVPLVGLEPEPSPRSSWAVVDALAAVDTAGVDAIAGCPTTWSIPPVRPAAERDTGEEIALLGSGDPDSSSSAVVDRIIAVVRERGASRHLRICLDTARSSGLRRTIDRSGLHGAATIERRTWFEESGHHGVGGAIVVPAPGQDTLATVVDCLARSVVPWVVDDDHRLRRAHEHDGRLALSEEITSLESVLGGHGIRADESAPVTDRAAALRWNELLADVHRVRPRTRARLADDLLRAVPATDVPDDPAPGTPAPVGDEQLVRADGSCVRWGGHVCEVRDDLLEPAVLTENMTWVADALERAHVPYLLLSDRDEPGRVAVEESRRAAVVDALREHPTDAPRYVDAPDRPGFRALTASLTASPSVDRFRVYRSLVTSTRSLRYGAGHGCSVELWRPEPSGRVIVSPPTIRDQSKLSSLEPTRVVEVGGRSLPVGPLVPTRPVDRLEHPVDAVWTWVDDADPQWRSLRADWDHTADITDAATSARFTNRDELRYSLRSVAMYAPWIRHCYIVTDDQVPDWLVDDHPAVSIVSHRDLFDDHSVLPTFNSHAIESRLHHIEGLSEHFLYFNDDVFLGRRVRQDTFFTESGHARVFPSPRTIDFGPVGAQDDGYVAARKNNRALIEATFGRTPVHRYLHTPHALRRSVLAEMEQRFSEAWQRTSAARFRSATDLAIVSSLHHDYARLTGTAVTGAITSRYIQIGTTRTDAILRSILAGRQLEALCLNDSGAIEVSHEETRRTVLAFMAAYFPVAAPWERR